MKRFFYKVHTPLVVLVDIAILASLISDWVAKRRARKEAKPASVPVATEEDPADE